MQAQIVQGDEVAYFVTNSWRPHAFNKHGHPVDKDGHVMVNQRTLQTNAFLSREEWERLDSAVIGMVRQKLNAYQDVIGAGLTDNTTLAEMYSKWRVGSERIAADVSMDFRTRRTMDRIDKYTYGVPVPIISCEYAIGRRELMVARAVGAQLETVEAEEAAVAVAEQVENILINGNTNIVVQGNSIPGYRTLAARDTGTAAAYGGGDFGTLSNIYPTFTGMLSALSAKRYNGPFVCYLNATQYHQMLIVYTDGSGQTALQRVQSLPQITAVKQNDLMTAAEMTMVQLTRNVVDMRVALALENRRWESPDGSEMHFVVMMSAVPRLKTDYAGNAGIAHATSC